jgi:hypothetical protein
MPTPPLKKKKALEKRLAGYSATAGAALLCAAGAGTAHATITNITTITPANSLNFQGQGAGTNAYFQGGPFNLAFFCMNTAGTAPVGYARWVSGGNAALRIGTAGTEGSRFVARNFSLGAAIEGPNFGATGEIGNIGPTGSVIGDIVATGTSTVATGYIGFRLVHSVNNTSYGWFRVQLTNDANGRPAIFGFLADGNGIYGAYAPKGDGLQAGEFAPIPEPSSFALGGLGLLALGAAGVREMRRRKAATVK